MADEMDSVFHIEHIIARQHRGPTTEANLALACPGCNLYKGTNLFSLDPDTNQPMRLFDPRKDHWEDHFRRDGPRIIGLTDVRRTTAWLLQFNSELNLLQRQVILELRSLD